MSLPIRTAIPPLVTVALLTILLIFPPLHSQADGKPGVPITVSKSFEQFADQWVKSCQRNFKGTATKKEVATVNGKVVTRYTQIDENSVSWKLKPTKSKETPYIGILSYKKCLFESQGSTRVEADAAKPRLAKRTKVTEIFRYTNNTWAK